MKVSWDDEIPNIWKVIKFMLQTKTTVIRCEQRNFIGSFHRGELWSVIEAVLFWR